MAENKYEIPEEKIQEFIRALRSKNRAMVIVYESENQPSVANANMVRCEIVFKSKSPSETAALIELAMQRLLELVATQRAEMSYMNLMEKQGYKA